MALIQTDKSADIPSTITTKVKSKPEQSSSTIKPRSGSFGGTKSPKKSFSFSSGDKKKKEAPVKEKKGGGKKVVGLKHIKEKEVIPFTRQAAGMLNAGMSIIATISTLEEQAAHPGFKSMLNSLRMTIEGGAPFSDGLAQYPAVFSDMYINMIRAGERSGQFAEIMKRLAALLDSSARLVRKVKSALTYPIVIMSLALIIAGALITFVVPVFAEMFAGFGSALPGPTQALVDLGEFVKRNWYYLLGGGYAASFFFKRWAATPQGVRKIHAFVLRLPVFGELILKVVIARFARLLGQMLSSGVPILDAMNITAKSCGNKVIEDSLMKAMMQVQEGQTLSVAMENKPFLPTLMIRMAAAGEKSGRLDEMLGNVADTYDDEVETMLGTLTSLMEPFLMVFLGAIIGTIVVAMFLPIFQMSSVVG